MLDTFVNFGDIFLNLFLKGMKVAWKLGFISDDQVEDALGNLGLDDDTTSQLSDFISFLRYF